MAKILKSTGNTPRRRAPAITLEDREQQITGLAVNLAEEQLLDKTASSQVITHFLKLATTRHILENEKLRRENEVLKAKAEAYKSAQNVEELYNKAINVMRLYSGGGSVFDDE